MPKNTFNDIIPPERRSIRNIQRSRTSSEPSPIGIDDKENDTLVPQRLHNNRFVDRGNMFFSKYGAWVIGFIVLVVLVVAFSLLFSGSKVVVIPKQKDVNVNVQFTAVREPAGDQLSYEIMKFDGTETRVVLSTGVKSVEDRAYGSIIIFNDFSKKEQRLITNTRFETPDGLVYRIREPIVLPGQKEGSDGNTVPGSIEVVVYADEPGPKFNISLVDFTIPGFKGTPQFDGFYARSKTPMSGGFVGDQVTVNKETLSKAKLELQEKLRLSLQDEANKNRPEGFQFFEGALFFVFGEPTVSKGSGDKAEVTQSGVAYGVIFRNDELAESIVSETVAGYEGESVRLDSTENLLFTIPTDFVFNPVEEGDIVFDLSGTARIIWLFDEQKLQNDLSGRQKEALPTILSGYPGIDRAEVILRPFWKQTFPEDPNKVSVELKLEKSNQ